MKEITITIDQETGETVYESAGFPGPTCAAPAEVARTLLGGPTTERNTPEFARSVRQAPRVRQQGGG